MPPPKLFILDSNAYFRLAYSLHPLLGQAFGKSKARYVLRVIAQLDKEYSRSVRLQHKFHWVRDRKFTMNRQSEQLKIAGKQNGEVEQARSYILSMEKDLGCDISLVDATALAYYRYIRILEDIVLFAEDIFQARVSDEDRAQSLHYLKANFGPGATIDVAYQGDRT